MNKLSAILLTACAAFSASAAEVDYCYADLADDTQSWGTTKSETYDVAIRLKDPALTGASIKGLRVRLADAGSLSGISGWLSQELHLESKLNVPDICSVEGTVSDGVLTVTFEEPYVITDAGVYAGYSFVVETLTEESRKPLATGLGTNPDGLYIHSSRTYLKWRSIADNIGMVSALEVLLDGDFDDPSISIAANPSYYFAVSADVAEIPVSLGCYSAAPLESIDLVASAPGVEPISYTQVFDPALSLQFAHSTEVALKLPNVFSKGTHDLTLTIAKVNGQDNLNAARTATTAVTAISQVPVKRPLMEEYTGLWCGWCTRGFAALEYLNETYPDRFVAVAYHNGGSDDPMTTVATKDYPNNVAGFPDSYLDRVTEGDPYYGSSNNGFGMEEDWKARCEMFSPIHIAGTALLDKDTNTVDVNATATAVLNEGADYKVQVMLTGDGLSDPSWKQSNYLANYYTQTDGAFSIPQALAFCQGGEYGKPTVSNLVFNDVLIMRSLVAPLAQSATLVVDEPMAINTTFNLNDALGYTGLNLAEMAKKLNAVVVVINANTGAVSNTLKIEVTDGTGVSSVSDAEVVSTAWYDLQGRPAAEGRGLLIRVDRLSDGSLRTAKVAK